MNDYAGQPQPHTAPPPQSRGTWRSSSREGTWRGAVDSARHALALEPVPALLVEWWFGHVARHRLEPVPYACLPAAARAYLTGGRESNPAARLETVSTDEGGPR